MPVFKMPKPVKVTGLSSSVTKSFVGGIIPCIKPTEEEIDRSLDVLGMTQETICCAYCGDPTTEWDHLNPLVRNKKPTGYISEIHNLVPACSKCNQSKSGRDWREWIVSAAPLSPKTRGVDDLEDRIASLERYEEAFEPMVIDFEGIVGEELWAEHWKNYEAVISTMEAARETSDRIKDILAQAVAAESLHNALQYKKASAKESDYHTSDSAAGLDIESVLRSIGKWFYLQNFNAIYEWPKEHKTNDLVTKLMKKSNGKGYRGTYTSVSEALRLRDAGASNEALLILLKSNRFLHDHPEAPSLIRDICSRHPELTIENV